MAYALLASLPRSSLARVQRKMIPLLQLDVVGVSFPFIVLLSLDLDLDTIWSKCVPTWSRDSGVSPTFSGNYVIQARGNRWWLVRWLHAGATFQNSSQPCSGSTDFAFVAYLVPALLILGHIKNIANTYRHIFTATTDRGRPPHFLLPALEKSPPIQSRQSSMARPLRRCLFMEATLRQSRLELEGAIEAATPPSPLYGTSA